MNTHASPMTCPAFELLRKERIDSLNIEVSEYRHRKTGAQHVHIAAENTENVFLVALRTVPTDSTGIAHVLEHTALCGSEKYQVRDPFFMMVRRSLNTFMNAFTSSDWTAYPFASQNKKDFNNLLDVYLDAVFFSRLDELDFAQEGHRVEFKDPTNTESELIFKGVVFNEMKGAMSSITSILWHTLCKYLYPTTTYQFNSGGAPECIPDLTHDQLKAFYKTHYHPSNAIFMTFGDIPVGELQANFEAKALHRFEPLDIKISVPDEKRYSKPITIQESYAFNGEEGIKNKTHIIISWLLGNTTNLEENMEAQLLSSILLDNSASPLQKALETNNIGLSPSPLCGLDDSQRELCFVCGIEGSEAKHADALEELVMSVLKDVAEHGVPQEEAEASLHQLELGQREIGGDGYPYGLQLILTALTNATHRGDPIALLDIDSTLQKLQRNIQNPNYIKQLVRRLLLENTHRVRLTLVPDTQLSRKMEALETERLTVIKESLDEAGKQAVVNKSMRLTERQQQKDDESVLPKVGLQDIPKTMPQSTASKKHQGSPLLNIYNTGTNGLVYQQAIIQLPKLTEEQLNLLPVYSHGLTELGIGDKSYLDTQRWQSQISGGLSGFLSAKGLPHDAQALSGHLILSTKGLANNQSKLTDLMQATIEKPRFDELPRIKELIAQTRARQESSITGVGHRLAMTAASRGATPGAKLAHQWGGLKSIRHIKQLDASLANNQNLLGLGEQLAELHRLVLTAPRKYLLIGETDKLDYKDLESNPCFAELKKSGFEVFSPIHTTHRVSEFWKLNTQVNFCAKSYSTVSVAHPDAAALQVLGEFLRNGYLHRTIREQGGAYGGGATQDNTTATFKFFSYRDPRLAGTLDDFDLSLDWLQNEKHERIQVEESILGVISSIDKPSSPAGEIKHAFHAELYGRSREVLELFRNQVREITLEDLQRVADRYLKKESASIAVISSNENSGVADTLNLSLMTL
jgi:presequence protease